jgi:hypothetical protein
MKRSTWYQNLAVFRSALTTAQEARSERREFLPQPDGTQELGWVLYERGQMLTAVNDLRALAGKQPVDLEDVLSAELRASGHIDYTAKFAMGCADLVEAA